MKRIEEGSGELVVARGDGPIDLEVADHALDAVALAVDALGSSESMALRWERGGMTARMPSASGARCGWRRCRSPCRRGGERASPRRARVTVFERRAVRRFPAGEVEDERDALGITETMNFTGEPAPRAAKSLFASPPFAPAAET